MSAKIQYFSKYLRKSRQTSFSGVVFGAEHESAVAKPIKAPKCLIRSLIRVKGQ